jgi:hypothetical protein
VTDNGFTVVFGGAQAAVTSLIGLRNWNHSFAKSGEMTGAPRHRWWKRRLQVAFLRLAIYEQTAGLQAYASKSNSVQTYASKSERLGPAGPAKPREARDSLQAYASSRANLWVK